MADWVAIGAGASAVATAVGGVFAGWQARGKRKEKIDTVNGRRYPCKDHPKFVESLVAISTRMESIDDGLKEFRTELWPVIRKHERVLGRIEGRIDAVQDSADDDTKGVI